jgi:hypothetical protein
MQDIIEISQVSDDSDEDDVDALIIELQEYLRIAVQTILKKLVPLSKSTWRMSMIHFINTARLNDNHDCYALFT